MSVPSAARPATTTEVLILGGVPTDLAAAVALRRKGVDTVLVERWALDTPTRSHAHLRTTGRAAS